jgi:predicted HicB family RNase H-like nuclease
MPTQSKPRKVGRPKMANGEAKAHVVVVRLHAEDYKAVTAKAKAKGHKLSEWIRQTLREATEA